jgi:type I pantothenate kinase
VSDAAPTVAALVEARLRTTRPVIVGIAGGVAVGKTWLANDVHDALAARPVEVVATDGFLLPNAELTRRGLVARKGFPESYDVDRLRDFLRAVRGGQFPQRVPTYSHATYDVTGEERTIDTVDVLIIEGVNVLGAAADLLDLGVYLDADEHDLETWFRRRFVALCDAARDDPTSFYRPFAAMDPADVDAVATQVCRDINLVNLRDHIAPTRARATCVITKGPDHEMVEVTVRDDDAAGPTARS